MGLKRINTPSTWRIPRKGTEKYLVKPMADIQSSLPLLMVLRDILHLAATRTEVLKIVREKQVAVNGRIRTDDRFPVKLRDFVQIDKIKKSYQLVLDNGKLAVREIAPAVASQRICKVIRKTLLPGKKVQITLDNGYSILSENAIKVNDSVLFDFKSSKVMKHIPLKEKAAASVFSGQNTGMEGTLTAVKGKGRMKLAVLKTQDGIKEVPLRDILITG